MKKNQISLKGIDSLDIISTVILRINKMYSWMTGPQCIVHVDLITQHWIEIATAIKFFVILFFQFDIFFVKFEHCFQNLNEEMVCEWWQTIKMNIEWCRKFNMQCILNIVVHYLSRRLDTSEAKAELLIIIFGKCLSV